MLVNTQVPRDTKAMVAKVMITANTFTSIIGIPTKVLIIIFYVIIGSSPIQCPAKDSSSDHGGDRWNQQKLPRSPGQAACRGEGGEGRRGGGRGGAAKPAQPDGRVGFCQPVSP